MRSIELAQAKDRLTELIERVEAGETVEITRYGRPVVRLTGVEGVPKPVDLAALRRLTETLPPQSQSAVDIMRAVRDDNACYLTSRYKTPKR